MHRRGCSRPPFRFTIQEAKAAKAAAKAAAKQQQQQELDKAKKANEEKKAKLKAEKEAKAQAEAAEIKAWVDQVRVGVMLCCVALRCVVSFLGSLWPRSLVPPPPRHLTATITTIGQGDAVWIEEVCGRGSTQGILAGGRGGGVVRCRSRPRPRLWRARKPNRPTRSQRSLAPDLLPGTNGGRHLGSSSRMTMRAKSRS